MLGLSTPGFGPEWLTAAMVTLLGLTREKLREAPSVSTFKKADSNDLTIN